MTRILVGDALDRLRELPDGSVHCCVTSPPYWGLRSYEGGAGMIGLEPTFESHLERLVAVFREVRRVLRPDGTCWLNYGDAYARGEGRGGSGGLCGTKQGTNAGSQTVRPGPLGGLKPKDLLMMPARVALALQQPHLRCRGCGNVAHALKWGMWPNGRRICPGCEKSKGADIETPGWWVRSKVIWHKKNPMPESCTDRPTSSYEEMLLLTKASRYFYDADAVRVPSVTGDSRRPYTSEGAWELDGRPTEQRHGGEQRETDASHANLRNVWTIPTHGFPDAHFATFPPALVEIPIKAGTSARGVCATCGAPWVRETNTTHENPGNRTTNGQRSVENRAQTAGFEVRREKRVETTGWAPSCACGAATVPATVLDPFCGSGTVGLVAERLQRDAILIDISATYAQMAEKRIRADAPLLTDVTITKATPARAS